MRKVGIVGGGMAGVSAAWLLDRKRDVMLLESEPVLGGNVQSIKVGLDGQTFVVDLGAQYFHPGPYPTYVKLLALLGLLRESHSFPATITLEATGETTPRFVSPLLPGRIWPALPAWNRAGLEAFAVAFADAKKREEENADWDVTTTCCKPKSLPGTMGRHGASLVGLAVFRQYRPGAGPFGTGSHDFRSQGAAG
jgi:monoamine oxidase